MRAIAVLCCLLFAIACGGDTPTGPTVGVNEQVTLAPGQTARVNGSDVRLQFVDVSSDSRCPIGVFCIQGGEAIVRIRASGGGSTTTYELHTGDASRAAASHGDIRFVLAQLAPFRPSGGTVAQSDYRATLEITRP
jgi:hypothetical protein